jgi:putative transposase
MAIKELNMEENLPIELLCGITQVSRAAYYKWKKRKPSDREKLNRKIILKTKALQEKVNGISGYRRMTMNLNRIMDMTLNHKRISRMMKIANIQSVIRRKKKRYPRSSPQHTAENVLNREFRAKKPNEKWVTDVTEFKYGHSKKTYLSAILDLY